VTTQWTSASLVAMACISSAACASIWGFDDLKVGDASGAVDGGAGDAFGVQGGDAGSDSSGRPSEASLDGETATADSGGVTEDVSVNDANATSADAAAATTSDAGPADVATRDGVAAVCSPVATQCTSNTQVETCGADGQWGTATTCEYACIGYVGGNCGGVCVPSTTQCAGSTGIETCGTNGQWQMTTTCSGGQVCQSKVCVCPSGLINCSGTCVDTATGTPGIGGLGPTNCGKCGTQCQAGGYCSSGQCG
jgi:hypothetical protein